MFKLDKYYLRPFGIHGRVKVMAANREHFRRGEKYNFGRYLC